MQFSLRKLGGAAASIAGALIFAAAAGTSPADAAPRCVDLFKRGGVERLINNCGQCLEVGVSRERRATQAPSSRRFILQPKSSFKLPFKGPGRTRIEFAKACQGTAGAAPNLAKRNLTEAAESACVSLGKDPESGNVFLINGCRGCRTTTLERFNRAGRSLGRQTIALAGSQRFRVPANGAARVGLAGEAVCPGR